jgi:predicted CXXCH cytochrome family protein
MPSSLTLSNKGELYCGTCHSAHGAGAAPKDSSSSQTSFFREKNVNSSLCEMCHTNEADYKRSNSHPLKTATFNFPDKLFAAGGKPGKEKNRVTCQSCHQAHGAKADKILLVDNKNSDLCMLCHNAQAALMGNKHDLRSSFPEERNIKQQRPSESGPCGVCHIPHNSTYKRLWARQLPADKDDREAWAQFCKSCHDKGKIAEQLTFAGTSHPLNVNPFEKIKALAAKTKKLSLPLFNAQGTQDNRGKMTCATCHDPHGSKVTTGKATPKKDVQSKETKFFLRDHPQEICEACHKDRILILNTKHDLSKVAPESKNILNKTPLETGVCGSCHLVHNGQKAFMWAREVDMESKHVAQAVCISCHNEKGMADKKAIKDYSHPVNISPFKKGLTTTLPLYDNDGKRSEKGDMACPTCHDPHRWDPLKVDVGPDGYDVEGSSKNSFLRLQNSPSPKLCGNCHADKAYIEKTDHDLMVSAPSSKNVIGQTPEESGVCGACHLVHNSENWAWLWAQDFGQGESLVAMMCNYCHSGKGPAKKKIPQVVSHPVELKISNLGRDDKTRINYFPLFSKNFGEPVSSEIFSCPSCHNVHQWGNAIPTKGKGTQSDGDATNSFLRTKSPIMICRDCHGEDSLFRYKYYHKADGRKK